jgi:hypothetical protein
VDARSGLRVRPGFAVRVAWLGEPRSGTLVAPADPGQFPDGLVLPAQGVQSAPGDLGVLRCEQQAERGMSGYATCAMIVRNRRGSGTGADDRG